MDNRKISDKYTAMGIKLIDEDKGLEYIKNSEATIVFLASEHEKKAKDKIILGQCEKVANKYKWGIPCDFTITLFEPNLVGLSEIQIERVILHELLHVGITKADGKESYYVRPHDLEDFKYMIDNYGSDWNIPEVEKPYMQCACLD